ncbi:hypothetical protein JCM6882_002461 [Rhodosporidiobolus microsporus]
MSDKLIFYDLVGVHGGPFYSPNTWKTRLSLLHKEVEFEEREVTYMELKEFAGRFGGQKPITPFIELANGELIWDSWRIAEWLEEKYPNKPSLFLPDAATPLNSADPALKLAKNYAVLVNKGYGDSDSQWSPFFELSAEGIAGLMPDESPGEPNQTRLYYQSDAKLGMKDAWKTLMSLDKNAMTGQAKASVTPLEGVLADSPFLTGQHPGFADYVVYGRYHMMRSACPSIAQAVWRDAGVPNVGKWIDRIEGKWAEQLKAAFARLPPI